MFSHPPLPPSDLDIFLGTRIRLKRPMLERLSYESNSIYFMRWARMHRIRVDFIMVNLSEAVSINPIVCTPVCEYYF